MSECELSCSVNIKGSWAVDNPAEIWWRNFLFLIAQSSFCRTSSKWIEEKSLLEPPPLVCSLSTPLHTNSFAFLTQFTARRNDENCRWWFFNVQKWKFSFFIHAKLSFWLLLWFFNMFFMWCCWEKHISSGNLINIIFPSDASKFWPSKSKNVAARQKSVLRFKIKATRHILCI